MAKLSINDIRARAAKFARDWRDAADEEAEAKPFWDALFEVYGTNRRLVAHFERKLRGPNGNLLKIDVLWPGVVLIEHKSRGKDLVEAREQARTYTAALKPKDRPRYVVVCDFARFVVEDTVSGESIEYRLEQLPEFAEALGFLGGLDSDRPQHEEAVDVEAVERLGALYDEMKKSGYPTHDLERFLVRVLFCLFADDTGIFTSGTFHGILDRSSEDGADLGPKLGHLFRILDTPINRRQSTLDERLADLPYVNGTLFTGALTFADMNREMRTALLHCSHFDWSRISPAIFGSLFQGVMEPAERRAAGAHYTSEPDILRVIEPLFLVELRAELAATLADRSTRRIERLRNFHDKLARLKFFDPACGCGNFLVIAYRDIRRLETEVLTALYGGQQVMNVARLARVNVDQFYGIEIAEFPCEIARVAMWLMDHVLNLELSAVFGLHFVRLPLDVAAHIRHANALQTDWTQVLAPTDDVVIMGNPPFVGKKVRDQAQNEDMKLVWGVMGSAGTLDYVTCWFRRAAEYITGTRVRCGLVSTNSITQGEQVGILWDWMFKEGGVRIHFAHRTFQWESEARGKAHVHVIIVGFGVTDHHPKRIFDHDGVSTTTNIGPYLTGGSDVAMRNRGTPLCAIPAAQFGNMPNDGGNLLFTDGERTAFLAAEPQAEPLFRLFVSAHEYLNGETRWCLWLRDAPPALLKACPLVLQRIEAVKKYRLKSKRQATRRLAMRPGQFGEVRQPAGEYVLIPRHSSESRDYVPLSYFDSDVIVADSCIAVPDATLYDFGVLSSIMHMAWMNVVAGRIKSDYRYSSRLVYNNFPWPEVALDSPQADAVRRAAQDVIASRTDYLPPSGTCTLADLYDPLTMPDSLMSAHQALDRAVDRCYRKGRFGNDRERVEHLFALYEVLDRAAQG